MEKTIVVEDCVNTDIANITDINNDNNKKHNRVLTQGDKLNLIKARKQTTGAATTCGSGNAENNQGVVRPVAAHRSGKTGGHNPTTGTTRSSPQPVPRTKTQPNKTARDNQHKRDGSRPTTRSTSGARRPPSPGVRSTSKNGRVKTGAVR